MQRGLSESAWKLATNTVSMKHDALGLSANAVGQVPVPSQAHLLLITAAKASQLVPVTFHEVCDFVCVRSGT